jgi:hypothetical protein
MAVVTLTDVTDLPSLIAAPRSVLLLSVPWSMPERAARAVFYAAADQLGTALSPAIQFFVMDEEAVWGRPWLMSLNIPSYNAAIGAGTILWMANGRLMNSVLSGSQLTAKDIVERTRFFWPTQTTNT